MLHHWLRQRMQSSATCGSQAHLICAGTLQSASTRSLQTCPFLYRDLYPHLYIVPWTHMSQPPNGISIDSATFAQLTCVPKQPNIQTDIHTHTYTHNATCDICSKRPHLSSVRSQCDLKWSGGVRQLQRWQVGICLLQFLDTVGSVTWIASSLKYLSTIIKGSPSWPNL